MKRFGLAAIFFSMVLAASAQTNPSLVATNAVPGGRTMSLEDCIQQALNHNFDIQIQRYTPEMDIYSVGKAYSGYDVSLSINGSDNFNVQPGGFFDGIQLPSETTKNDEFSSTLNGTLPTGLQYTFNGAINQEHFLEPNFPPNSGGNIGVQLTQPLLQNFWIDQTRLNIKVAKNLLKTDEQGFRNQIITSITAVQTAYYELIYQLEYVKVQEEALDLSQTQLDQDNQRLQIGTLAQLSVEQDQSQVAQNQSALISAQSQLVSDQDTLKGLITDNFSKWQGTDIQPAEVLAAPLILFNLEDSWSRGLSERPDFIQAKLKVEKAGIQLKFDFNQLFPQLDVIGSYGWNGDGVFYSGAVDQIEHGSAPYYSYGGQLKVPLGNIAARSTYKSDKLNSKQLILTLKQLEQTIMVQIDEAVKKAQSDYQSVQATREARIYAEAALDAEQKTYGVGKATTFEVLTYQNNLTTARGQELRALANYEEDLANLNSDEGSTLDKLGITIDVD